MNILIRVFFSKGVVYCNFSSVFFLNFFITIVKCLEQALIGAI